MVHASSISRTAIRLSWSLMLLMPLLLMGSSANASSLDIHTLSSPTLVVAPSELITHVFQVLNRSQESVEIELDLELPPGWIHLGIPHTLTLEPSASETLFATVIVPTQFTGTTTHTLVARIDGSPVASSSIDVEAQSIYDARLTLSGPLNVLAGQQVSYTLTVVNRGNEKDSYVLSATSRRAWPIAVEPEILSLEPGELGYAQVTLAVPRDVAGSDMVTIIALSTSTGEAIATTRLSPKVGGALAQSEPLIPMLPARATVRYAPTDGLPKLSLTAGGPISLDRRNRLDLELLVKGTVLQSAAIAYSRDSWRIGLRHSRPTSSATDTPNVSSVELLHTTDRYILEVDLTDTGEQDMYLLYRAGQLELDARRRIGYRAPVALGAKRANSTSLGLSYSGQDWFGSSVLGRATRQESAGAHAHDAYLSGSGRIGEIRITGTAQYTEPGFRDNDGFTSLSASAFTPLGDRAQLSGRVTRSSKLAEQGWLHPQWTQQVWFSHATPAGLSIDLQQSATWRLRDLELHRFDLRLSGTARLPSGSRPFRPTVNLSLDRSADMVAGTTIWSGTAKVTWPLRFRSQDVTLTLEGFYNRPRDGRREHGMRADAATSFTHGSAGLINLRAGLAYNMANETVLPQVSIGYTRFLSPVLQLDARLDWGLHESRTSTRFDVSLRYNFDLPLPIPIRGSVEGRLVSSSPQVDVAGRIVGIGNLRALTDHEGRFVFPALEPGTHEVFIENLPAQVQTVPERASVTVHAGRTSHIELELVPTAAIEGVVHVDPSTIVWGDVPSVGNLRISLYQDEQVLRVVRTSSDGRFQFTDLLPGRYKVVLDTAGLPANTLASQTAFSVDLGEGEWHTVEFPLAVIPPTIDFMALPPSANFTYAPAQPEAGEAVTFTSQSIVDFTRSVRSLVWDMGDGHTLQGSPVNHAFSEPGTYVVRLRVTDSAGETGVAERTVTVK